MHGARERSIAAASMHRLVLASRSPRRKDLLEAAGYRFEIRAASIDEGRLDAETPLGMAVRLAIEKATAAVAEGSQEDEVFVAADTIVVSGDKVYGKPESPREAFQILQELLGRNHDVLTGWAVMRVRGDAHAVSGVTRSLVRMREAGSREIEQYIESGEPMDKAGAYAAQGLGRRFVAAVVGPLDNVIGLPVEPVARALSRFGIVPHREVSR